MANRHLCLALLAPILTSGCGSGLRLSNGINRCRLTSGLFQVHVDVASLELAACLKEDDALLCGVYEVWLTQEGRRYTSRGSSSHPHLHSLRSGPHLIELHLENLVLAAGDETWPGVAELSLFCHRDRLYVLAEFLLPEDEWVNRGTYVYQSLEDHCQSAPVKPTDFGVSFALADGRTGETGPGESMLYAGEPSFALSPTVPEGRTRLTTAPSRVSFSCVAGDDLWQPGSVHEVGAAVHFGEGVDMVRRALVEEGEPLPTDAFAATMGECLGYDRARGVYRIKAKTSHTPEPPRGLRAGAHYTVRSDDRRRTILIDQFDPWGGISGGIIRDGQGLPLPVVPQFGLNFPEQHREAGESGWATMTYPLDLAPNETREIKAEHLYHALSDRELIYLTSLDNIGNPLLLQTTVGRTESHTLTTGPYPGEMKPGNELRLNDFRRIYSQNRVRSVSAILPTFFGYYDADDKYRGLMPADVIFQETGPFLIEYVVMAATPDGTVTGAVNVWQAAHEDMTRVFTNVRLQVEDAIELSTRRPAPLFFLRHHAFNPMAFMRFAYTAEDGKPKAGELTYSRTVVANGEPMGDHPFACLYRASNPLDQGLPCSDITGNAGFVLLDWDVTFGDHAVRPGCYAFCTGANDEPDGPYARDVALVPRDKVTVIPAGSEIKYSAVQMVWGDNSSDFVVMERERQRWALNPLAVTASVGEVESGGPPHVIAAEGRVECELSGGADWIPIRVSGFDPALPLHVRRSDADGVRNLGPGAPGEPWYNAWPMEDDADDRCGFTFLLKIPEDGAPVRLEVWQ